jgi:hypothetical protein
LARARILEPVTYRTIANACAVIKGKLEVQRTADLIRLTFQMRDKLMVWFELAPPRAQVCQVSGKLIAMVASDVGTAWLQCTAREVVNAQFQSFSLRPRTTTESA